ncbi:MAG: Ribosome biogenesis protein erb1 [Trizodia sp. TS-e1964]|nr:MAG: Ribosome biogenesis protein erb1 [Trizodia sp. TS-e1964]
MAAVQSSRKRKAITLDTPDAAEIPTGHEFDIGLIHGTLSQSEDSTDGSDEEANNTDESRGSEDELDSDETPSIGDLPQKSFLDHCHGPGLPTAASNEDKLSEDGQNYTISKDANGNTRYIYSEIDPIYDSDDSDGPGTVNTVGNIPLSFYDSYPHIGYNINGKKIMRPAKGEALDSLLDSIEIPKGWTGLTDPATGKNLELSLEELEVLKRIQMNEVPEEGYDPYPIMKIVQAIREGRILPYKPPTDEEEDTPPQFYDVWANEVPRSSRSMHIPAPKLSVPSYDLSYNPPPEYLPTGAERKAWEDMDEEDRNKEYIATGYTSLRRVPGYEKFIKERFERSLDLYLAPRIRRNRLNIDPESLLPKLPSPDELRPFPTTCATIFRGHDGRVRSLAIDPSGLWLASGGDDGIVRVWELLTGYQAWSCRISHTEAIHVVRWRPGADGFILSAAAGESIFLMVPSHLPGLEQVPLVNPEITKISQDILDAGWGYATIASSSVNLNSIPKKDAPATWSRPGPNLENQGVRVKVEVRKTVKSISWHRRGDYFSSVSPTGQNSSVAIHTLSKHLTQLPFRHSKGLPQTAQFHPSRPYFFVATQRTIRSYDLQKQELLKVLQPGARWISSIDVHPGGDNLIVGSYDKRLLWHDLDLSVRPYKTLRYHAKAIRAVRFHRGVQPLFASASDDGTLQIFHGKVVDDLMQNATIVPLKVLRGHQVKSELGILDLDWHPHEPWCVSAGADGTCRLWN